MNKELFARLGNPQIGQNFIHVAGTNGKGSTCAMLASILQCAGYKVGLYTSPHLARYTERIKINGEEISQDEWDKLKEEVEKNAEGLNTVEFDLMTAMAFLKFKEADCDIVVLEVGLGGRFDATNVIEKPLVSVITQIGLEHTEILGDTISQIAFEKSGIIKEACPVVASYQTEDALNEFIKAAKEKNAELIITDPTKETLHSLSFDGQVISYKEHKGIRLNLLGSYQYKNIAVVLDTIDVLKRRYNITEDAIKEGLAKVVWPGRFEVLRKSPLVILDGAHNPNGAAELAECIKSYIPRRKIHFVMGVLADKNYQAMLDKVAPFAKKFTLVTPDSKRALSANDLQNIIKQKYNVETEVAENVSAGVLSATTHQDFKEPVVIFGSLYQVADVRKLFDKD